MRNYILVVLISLLNSAFAQFSTQTEFEYLKLIHTQHDKKLIEDNIRNAELKAFQIIQSASNDAYAAAFINELSKSFFLLKEYDKVMFYVYAQRFLFPNDTVEKSATLQFNENLYRLGFQLTEIDSIKEKMSQEIEGKTFNDRAVSFLKFCIYLQKKSLDKDIVLWSSLLKQRTLQNPNWLQHWEYLTLTKIKVSDKIKFIESVENKPTPVYTLITEQSLKNKVYRKSITHYLKTNSFSQSALLLSDYKVLPKSLLAKTDWYFKRTRLFLHL
ncbi:MAG: hypothetical protein JXR60_07375 [Bacteroidales bacterium]|nr:hypothetical protein [Bacteroidales bacterium]